MISHAHDGNVYVVLADPGESHELWQRAPLAEHCRRVLEDRVTELRKKTSNKDAVKAERAQSREPMPATAEDQRLRRQAKQGSDDLLRALMKFFKNREQLQNSIARQDVTT